MKKLLVEFKGNKGAFSRNPKFNLGVMSCGNEEKLKYLVSRRKMRNFEVRKGPTNKKVG